MLAFNTIKYNAPLAFIDKRITDLSDDPLEGFEALIKILRHLEDEREIEGDEKNMAVKYLRVNRGLFINTLSSLDLLCSLRKLWFEYMETTIDGVDNGISMTFSKKCTVV